jgi:hypothetical protein
VHLWAESERREPGAIVPLATAWALAQAWYADRLRADWRRLAPDEAEAVFERVGLRGAFWRLPTGPRRA